MRHRLSPQRIGNRSRVLHTTCPPVSFSTLRGSAALSAIQMDLPDSDQLSTHLCNVQPENSLNRAATAKLQEIRRPRKLVSAGHG